MPFTDLAVLLLVLAPSLCACHGGLCAPCEACGCCCPRNRMRLGLVDEYQLVQFVLGFKGTQFLTTGVATGLAGAVAYNLCVHGGEPAREVATGRSGVPLPKCGRKRLPSRLPRSTGAPSHQLTVFFFLMRV